LRHPRFLLWLDRTGKIIPLNCRQINISVLLLMGIHYICKSNFSKMSHNLRSWLFAISVLLLAEDFQYLLKIHDGVCGRSPIEKMAMETDKDGSEESKADEGKNEGKCDKDDDNKYSADELLISNGSFVKISFSETLAPLSAAARDLESPPPEV